MQVAVERNPETFFVFIHYGMLQRSSCSSHCLNIGTALSSLCWRYSPVSLKMASNLFDLVLSDQLYVSPFQGLKAIILSSRGKELLKILLQCLERTGSITEHLKFEIGGGKNSISLAEKWNYWVSLLWSISITQCILNNLFLILYIILPCILLASDAHHCSVLSLKWTERSLVITVVKFLSLLHFFYYNSLRFKPV